MSATDDDGPVPPSRPSNPLGPHEKVTRHVMPLGPRVLVRLRKSEDRSAGGLFLPAGAKDAVAEALFAEVVEVARATDDPEPDGFGANVSGVPLGAFVLFPKNEGTPVPWDEELRLLEVKHVLATVEEIHLEQAH